MSRASSLGHIIARTAYYLLLVFCGVVSFYFVYAMLRVRPQAASKGIYFDYMLYRKHAQQSDRVQLRIYLSGNLHPSPTPKFIVSIEQVPPPDEEARLVFLI